MDVSARGGDLYLAMGGDLFVATSGDTNLATRGDFFMATDTYATCLGKGIENSAD